MPNTLLYALHSNFLFREDFHLDLKIEKFNMLRLKLKMGKKSKTGSCQSRTIFIDENHYHATDFEENYPENEASACIIPLLLSEMLELAAAVKEPIRNERQPVLGSRCLLSASTAMKTARCRSLQPPANVLFTDVGFYVILCCWVFEEISPDYKSSRFVSLGFSSLPNFITSGFERRRQFILIVVVVALADAAPNRLRQRQNGLQALQQGDNKEFNFKKRECVGGEKYRYESVLLRRAF